MTDSATGPKPPDTGISRALGQTVFAARWLMAPLYFGMVAALGLIAVKFVQKLVVAIPAVLTMSSNEVILTALTTIDLTLVANLVLMVMFAGWENFVAPFQHSDAGDRPDWLAGLDFTRLKLKLIASVAVIAAIFLLETMMDVADIPRGQVLLEIGLTLCFAAVGVLLALMDRLGGH